MDALRPASDIGTAYMTMPTTTGRTTPSYASRAFSCLCGWMCCCSRRPINNPSRGQSAESTTIIGSQRAAATHAAGGVGRVETSSATIGDERATEVDRGAAASAVIGVGRVATLSISDILVRGDLFTQPVTAIVNPANVYCLGGGGVDGLMHRKAGPALLAECSALPTNARGERCPVGGAVITKAHNLTNATLKHIIHTVGPDCNTMTVEAARPLLAAAYRSSLQLALDHGIRSVAFPAISAGIFAYPFAEAIQVAVQTIQEFYAGHPGSFDAIKVVLLPDAYDDAAAAVGI